MSLAGANRRVRAWLARGTPAFARPHLVRLFRNARFRANTWIGRSPTLFEALHRHDATYRDRLVNETTEIVIEGAPRVASTYCVHAFARAQQRRVAIATHTHLPANVLRAARMGKPALVVIRDPVATARSGVLRNRDLAVASVLHRYQHFYVALEPILDRIVLADFEEVILNLGVVIERVNIRFGTVFTPWTHDPDGEAAVASELRQRDRLLDLDPLASFLPHESKQQAKSRVHIDPRNRRLRACVDLYRRLSPIYAGPD